VPSRDTAAARNPAPPAELLWNPDELPCLDCNFPYPLDSLSTLRAIQDQPGPPGSAISLSSCETTPYAGTNDFGRRHLSPRRPRACHPPTVTSGAVQIR
jgi:hypothetical protein